MNIKLITLFLFVILCSQHDIEAKVIAKIEYRGNKRVDSETIKAHMSIEEGDDIDEDDQNEALKRLYNTGFFDDIEFKIKGSTLIVNVKESPTINKISFEGNKKLKEEDINKNFPIKPKETLSRIKVKTIQMGLLEIYRKMGIYGATVNPKIIKLPNNQVNLIFEINEMTPSKISRIVFHGNKIISTSELRQAILSRPKRWYRFFAQDDIYDSDRIEADKLAIIQYYREHGFAQAKVISADVELDKEKRGFIITFRVDEGDIFKFGNITLNSKVKNLNTQGLNNKPYCKTGKRFNSSLLAIDTSNIINNISNRGYLAVEVVPHFVPDLKQKKIDVQFDITQGEKKYISKIVIKGNTKTRDYVILKELPFEEGDIYSKSIINIGENNLKATGFFSRVTIEQIPDPIAPDKCIVEITVEENKTTEIQGSVGYATQDGPSINFQYGEQNFLGTGKSLHVSIDAGRESSGPGYKIDSDGKTKKIKRRSKFEPLRNANITIADSHLFGRDLSGSLSIFRYSSTSFDTFEMKNYGGSLGSSYVLIPGWSQSWELGLTRRIIKKVEDLASPLIKAQLLPIENDKFQPSKNLGYNQGTVQHSINYSTYSYDELFKGKYSMGLSTSILYNTNNKSIVLRNILSGVYGRPIGRNVLLKLNSSIGILTPLNNKDISIADSFTSNLNSLRGFDEGSCCPKFASLRRIKNTKTNKWHNSLLIDTAGAKKFFKGSLEMSFPIGLPVELNFRTFLFLDFGYYWDPIISNKKILNRTKYSLDELDKIHDNGKKTDNDDNSASLNTSTNKEDMLSTKYENSNLKLNKVLCKFEDDDDFLKDKKLVGHQIFNDRKLRISAGFGFSLDTPFGPIEFSFGFPIKKCIFDKKQVFNFGAKMGI